MGRRDLSFCDRERALNPNTAATSQRSYYLPKLREPGTLEAALDRLVSALERHRLLFLYFMEATRLNPAAVAGATGVRECVRKGDLPGHDQYVATIDTDGEFLLRERWFLDRYANEAISCFGPGDGIKPDVDGASHPYWSLDEGGAPYLDESADAIQIAAKCVRRFDTDCECEQIIAKSLSVTHDLGRARWYTPIVTRWSYLGELEAAIATVKHDSVLIACPRSRDEAAWGLQDEWYYLTATYDESMFNHDPAFLGTVVGDPDYYPVDSGTLYFFKVKGEQTAKRLVRLFDLDVKPNVECVGETRLRVSFGCQREGESDEDQRFLIEEKIQHAQQTVERAHDKWRAAEGLKMRDGVAIAGAELLAQRPPLKGNFTSPNLYDQASRWAEKIAAETSEAAREKANRPRTSGSAEKQAELAPPETLRTLLPTAVIATVSLRDLTRISVYYPGAISQQEAESIRSTLIGEMTTAASLCGLSELIDIALSEQNEVGLDTSLSAAVAFLCMRHPDFKADPSSPDGPTGNMKEVLRICQDRAVGPTKEIVERLVQTMLYDCRIPKPTGDDSFREPQRFLQMLRLYWGIIRRLIVYHTDSMASYQPHPLTPLVMNLKARIDSCLEVLSKCEGASSAGETITSLVEIVLSADHDALQVVPECSFEQVGSVDRFIEATRLKLGAKSYPLTAAEEMCIECGDKAIDDYTHQVDAEWTKVIKRLNAAGEKKAASKDSPTPKVDPQPQAHKPEPSPFSGGTMRFLEKSVELCGVDICSGPRSEPTRKALDLLRQKNTNGVYQAYSGEELAQKIGRKPGQNSAAGLIRDLRKRISEALRAKASIQCGDQDVILSGGPGYRLSDCIIVQEDGKSANAPITDTRGKTDVRNIADDDVPDVRDTVLDVRDEAVSARRAWILERLTDGDKLQAPAVAKHFKCSAKTAQRDLTALKDDGKIKFVGSARTGYYVLCEAPKTEGRSGR